MINHSPVKKTRRLKLFLVLLVTLFIFSQSGLPGTAEPDKGKAADPLKLLTQADNLLEKEKWKDAWQLYQQILQKHGENKQIKDQKKIIELNIKLCEKKIGIVTNIANLFNGHARVIKKYKTDYLYLDYDFADSDQIEDFKFGITDKVTIEGSKLKITARADDIGMVTLNDAIFTDYLTIEFDAEISNFKTAFGGLLFMDEGKDTGYMFLLNSEFFGNQRVNLIAIMTGQGGGSGIKLLTAKNKPRIGTEKKYHIKFTSARGTHRLYVNKKMVKQSRNKDITRGIVGLSCMEGSVLISNLKIEGLLDRQWVKKTLTSVSSLALAAQEEDLTKPRYLTLFEPIKGKKKELAALPPQAQIALAQSTSIMEKLVLADSIEQFQENLKNCIEKLDAAIEAAPQFDLTYYYRGCLYFYLPAKKKSLADLCQAINVNPDFHEAYKKRGDIYLGFYQLEEAMNDYQKAIEINGDYSYGYSGRGYLYFILGEEDKAVADLTRAVDLDPENDEARENYRNIKHVIKGPTWRNTYVRETKHYIVKTNISRQKCRIYAAFLEAIRNHYARVFSIRNKSTGKKSVALIFETEIGYQAYAMLTTESGAESTLGYYHPHYRQLLLFEPIDQEEATLKVMYHEAFHMFLHEIMDMDNIPIWLNEGMAEYFGGTRITYENARTRVKTGLIHQENREILLLAMENDRIVSFEKIMNESKREFYGPDGSFRYAQAWSMVHFFTHYKNGVYAHILKKYFLALKKGQTGRPAFRETFGQEDLKKMRREWREYVLKLKPDK